MTSTPKGATSTRGAILDAASRLFAEHGGIVRLEDIAEAAGVSRQTVYVHFGSRTGLLVAMAQHLDEGGTLHRLVQQVFEAASAVEALDAVVTVHADYYPLAYPVAKVFMSGRRDDEALRAAWDDRMTARRNLYREVVEWLQRDATLAPGWDVETGTDMLWTMTSWEVWEQLVQDRGWSKDQYCECLRTVLQRALVAPQADAPSVLRA